MFHTVICPTGLFDCVFLPQLTMQMVTVACRSCSCPFWALSYYSCVFSASCHVETNGFVWSSRKALCIVTYASPSVAFVGIERSLRFCVAFLWSLFIKNRVCHKLKTLKQTGSHCFEEGGSGWSLFRFGGWHVLWGSYSICYSWGYRYYSKINDVVTKQNKS